MTTKHRLYPRLCHTLAQYGVTRIGAWYPQDVKRRKQIGALSRGSAIVAEAIYGGVVATARYGVLPVWVFWCEYQSGHAVGVYCKQEGGASIMDLSEEDGGRWTVELHIENMLE